MGISTAVDASAVARVVGIKTEFKDLRGGGILYLPQRVAIVGQGNTGSTYSLDKWQATSALAVAQRYGYGSPLHLAAQQLLPVNGDGVGSIPVTIYPMDDDGAGVASEGDITLTGTASESGSLRIKVNEVLSEPIVITSGDAGVDLESDVTAAINAVLDMPVTAADGVGDESVVTSKWKGASANDITLEVVGEVAGITVAFTQPVNGANNPDVDVPLAKIGNVWETMILNCLDVADTATLDKYQTFGVGRWGALVRKPCVVFSGEVSTTVAAAITVPDARKDDYVNAQLVAPGSKNLPFVVAARQLARIVKVANNNPAHDYGSQDATGLEPGDDGDQWNYVQRDQAVKGGSSTIEVKDGVVNVADVITFYHPSGDPLPAYRHVVDIVKLQNIIFNLNLEFATDKWDGAPLIPDDQPTTNPDAKKPKTAKAAAAAIVDSLGLNAIISDPESTKTSMQAEIDPANPKRLNLVLTVALSGNTNIISIDLNFGFYFGTPAVVA